METNSNDYKIKINTNYEVTKYEEDGSTWKDKWGYSSVVGQIIMDKFMKVKTEAMHEHIVSYLEEDNTDTITITMKIEKV